MFPYHRDSSYFPNRQVKMMENQPYEINDNRQYQDLETAVQQYIIGIDNSEHRVGIYTLEERKQKILLFRQKRLHSCWRKKINYSCRKIFADGRPRVKGRFTTKDIEMNLASNDDEFTEFVPIEYKPSGIS